MYLCLSSGASEQYQRDILRALAQPAGSVLEFRYQQRWVAQTVTDAIQKGTHKQETLIAYIDQATTGPAPVIYPARFAEIDDAHFVAGIVKLRLRLGAFASTPSLAEFNDDLRKTATGLPTFTAETPPSGERKASGMYWLEVIAQNRVKRSTDLAAWEETVKAIAGASQFANEPVFYHIVGLSDVESRKAVAFAADGYNLQANRLYELSLYHFHPARNANAKLKFRSPRLLSWVTSSELTLEARYDERTMRFGVENPPIAPNDFVDLLTGKRARALRSHSVLSVLRGTTSDPDGKNDVLDFDLPIVAHADWKPIIRYGALLGLLLALPQVIAVSSNLTLPGAIKTALVVIIVLLNILAGTIAAFGLRK